MAPQEIPVEETMRVVVPLSRWFSRRCRLDAEDLASIGVLAVCQQARDFDPGLSPWPRWCHRVAKHAMMRAADVERARHSAGRLWPGATWRESPLPGPFVVSALATLTDKQAETLSMFLALDGGEPRSERAVAHMLGVSKKLVQGRVNRSLARLRKYLSEGGGDS